MNKGKSPTVDIMRVVAAGMAAEGNRQRRVLILVNEKFEDKRQNREGAEWDLIKMNTLFTALGFLVTAYKDLTAKAMKTKLKMFVTKAIQDCMQLDCLAVVISSHGQEVKDRSPDGAQGDPRLGQQVVKILQSVLGTDGETLMLEEMFELFRNQPNLKDKLKLFFIQACRSRPDSEAFDPGVPITVKLIKMSAAPGSQPSDGWRNNDNTLRQLVLQQFPRKDPREEDEWQDENKDPALPTTTEVQSETKKIVQRDPRPDTEYVPPLSSPTPSTRKGPQCVPPVPDCETVVSELPANCLVVSSATLGRVSYRDTLVGSLLYHFMYQHAASLLEGENILRFITLVAGQVADLELEIDGKTYKNCISSHHTLCRRVSFESEKTKSLLSQLH